MKICSMVKTYNSSVFLDMELFDTPGGLLSFIMLTKWEGMMIINKTRARATAA